MMTTAVDTLDPEATWSAATEAARACRDRMARAQPELVRLRPIDFGTPEARALLEQFKRDEHDLPALELREKEARAARDSQRERLAVARYITEGPPRRRQHQARVRPLLEAALREAQAGVATDRALRAEFGVTPAGAPFITLVDALAAARGLLERIEGSQG